MAIVAGDLVKSLTGASSDGGSQTDPNAALGAYRSSTTITDNTDNNLFDDVSGAEASAGDTEYRCIAIQNKHASLELQNAKIYMQDSDIGGTNVLSFAVETPATANLTNGNAQTVADESTAPTVNTTDHNGTGSGISNWSTGTTYTGGVAVNIGAHDANLGVDEIIFVWIKREIASSATAASAVNFTIRLEGDTAA